MPGQLSIGSLNAARLVHELMRLYHQCIDDPVLPHWNEASDEMRASVLAGVAAIVEGRVRTPAESHDAWMAARHAAGWKWGPAKIDSLREDPNLIEWGRLAPEQRMKDSLFYAVVSALIE